MSVVFAKNGWSLEGPRANIVFMFSVNVSVGGTERNSLGGQNVNFGTNVGISRMRSGRERFP